MDEDRFYKRLESLEKNSQETAIQLTRLNTHIESETGNVGKHIDAIYKIIDRHEKLLFGNNEAPGLLTSVSEFKGAFTSHNLQDRWMFGIMTTILVCILTKLLHG